MISIVVTSFNEPKTIGKAIDSFINQDIREKYEFYVASPEVDKETYKIVKEYQKKNKNIKYFKDPGKGKSYAINLILSKLKGNILIFSDGDSYVSENSVNEIIDKFKEENVGCVTGRPVSQDSKDNIFGFWSHLLCDAGAHEARLKRARKKCFLECSGYLWAFRNKIIKKFPIDIAEDTVVPLLFREKNYRTAYAQNAKVYVKFPTTLRDFIKQKNRTVKSHKSLEKYVNVKKLPRTKTFRNELLEGYKALFYPKKFKEFVWTFFLFPIRLYIWILAFYHTKIKEEHYTDGWERIESTK